MVSLGMFTASKAHLRKKGVLGGISVGEYLLTEPQWPLVCASRGNSTRECAESGGKAKSSVTPPWGSRRVREARFSRRDAMDDGSGVVFGGYTTE